MDSIGERILYLRKSNKLTQKNLIAKIKNVSHTSLSRIENDSVDPSVSDIIEISKYFNVSTDWLLTGKGGMHNEKGEFLTKDEYDFIKKYRRLNRDDKLRVYERMLVLIEQYEINNRKKNETTKQTINQTVMKVFELPASAGFGTYTADSGSQFDILPFNEDEVPRGADYGIRIRGDSMTPLIQDGDIVWVEEQSQVDNGAIGIFIVGDNAYCKKLDIDYGSRGRERTVRLLSLNPEYEPMVIGGDDVVRTIGKVLIKCR